MSSLVIFFLLCLSMHACYARPLATFVAEEIGNQVHFLPKDVNKLNLHDLETRSSILKEGQTSQLTEAVIHGRTIRKNLVGANTIKQTLLNCFLKAKEAFAEDISGNEIKSIISSGVDDLQKMEKVQGLKRVTRSMLGNSAGDTDEAVGSNEKENAGDIDVMDYAQPHRKPPIHNEKHQTITLKS